jgi:hypothetical protein
LSTASDTVDESEAEAAPRPGLAVRLKRLLAAPVLLLRRLRRARTEAVEIEAEAELPDRRDARRDEAVEEDASAPVPPRWRRLLPYGLALLAGLALGGGSLYGLSAQVIARQAAELNEQQAEVARLKGLVAGYDQLVLQNKKKLEEEQSKRVALENRLATAQADLARQPASGSGSGGRGTPAQTAAGQPGKAGDCTLRPGSIGSTLKDCLAEFNRP